MLLDSLNIDKKINTAETANTTEVIGDKQNSSDPKRCLPHHLQQISPEVSPLLYLNICK